MADRTDNQHYVFERVGAQRSATLVQLAAVLIAMVCVTGAAMLQSPINEQRRDLELVMNSNIYEGLPAKYAWVSAAGASFRGVAASFLWTRMEELKQEGKYYEAHQLAKWICTVQPHFPEVWIFQSWNMAYNISVGTKTKEERWLWVYNGIRLLRDEGLPHNDKSVPMYHQLTWIWFHKVGATLDDFHLWYKRYWAGRMEILLGHPPIVATDEEKMAWFQPVADAPRTLAELIDQRPGVAPLVEQLDELDIDLDVGTNNGLVTHPLEDSLFTSYTRWVQLKGEARYLLDQPELSDLEKKRQAFFAQHDDSDFAALMAFARAKVLREQYKMDPAFMQKMATMLNPEILTPIDWRTPWSQALYWALYGEQFAKPDHENTKFDSIRLDRILLFGLKNLAKEGQFIVRVDVDDPFMSNLSMLVGSPTWTRVLHEKYLAFGPKYAEEGEEINNTTAEALRSGHVNFLRSSVVRLYLAGYVDEAQEYLDYLAAHYPNQITGQIEQMHVMPIDEFVRAEFDELRGNHEDTRAIISSALDGALRAAAMGDMSRARRSLQEAQQVHEEFQEDKREDLTDRRRFEEFHEFLGQSLARVILGDAAFDIVDRSGVWNGLNALGIDGDMALQARQHAYMFVAQFNLREQYRQAGYDFDRVFEKPKDFEAYVEAYNERMKRFEAASSSKADAK